MPMYTFRCTRCGEVKVDFLEYREYDLIPQGTLYHQCDDGEAGVVEIVIEAKELIET